MIKTDLDQICLGSTKEEAFTVRWKWCNYFIWVLTRSWERGFGVQIRLGGCVAAKPKQGDCRDLEIPASECMYTLLWMYSVFSLLVIQSLVHTQTWSLHRPWVSSQTVKCSVSVPSHGVPSALGFAMTCTDISAMLDLCAEQARMPSRSTNTFPRYSGTERKLCESLKVCYFVYAYMDYLP